MSTRGAVELVIADIALEAGSFEVVPGTAPTVEYMFSAVVVMAVVTTLVNPVLLKRIYLRMPS
jgi:Kef-type K+ transport system membrane component KefB